MLGQYTITEIPGEPLLNRVFDDEGGNLYKPDGRGAHLVEYVEASFHKKTNEDGSYEDVQQLIAALQDTDLDREAWRAQLEEHIDMAGFIRFLAVNQALSNWDTYGVYAHNYYLYARDGEQQLHFMPWDFDLALNGPSDLTLTSFDGSWPLIQAVVHDPTYNYAYHQELRSVHDKLFVSDELADHVTAWAEVVGEQASSETFEVGSHEDALANLKTHIASQDDKLETYLEARGVD